MRFRQAEFKLWRVTRLPGWPPIGESPEAELHVASFSLPHPSLFETSLTHRDSLATVLFPQPLAAKTCLSETAGELSCPSGLAPTLSFAYQSARQKSLINCCPPKGSQVLLLTSIFRLIPFAFFHCATFCQISAQRKFL